MRFERFVGVATVIVVLSAVGLAFTTLGSPRHQRDLAIDDQREQHLYRIAATVNERYAGRGISLPRVLPRDAYGVDTIANQPFEYRRIDKARYELCTTFNLASDTAHESQSYFNTQGWTHAAGHVCYHLNKNATSPTHER